MTKISTKVIQRKDTWSAIEVPFGSTLVWAKPFNGGVGVPNPGPPVHVKLYFSGPDQPIGKSTCLVRMGSEESDSMPGKPPVGGDSGISDATAFVSDDVFLWWKIDTFGVSNYPPN